MLPLPRPHRPARGGAGGLAGEGGGKLTADGRSALADLRSGGKPALARTLARIERTPADPLTIELLDDAHAAPVGHVLGLTGPPGVGKSTLVSVMLRGLRQRSRSVGIIAVDPSSRRTGGALLGDRTRIDADPGDDKVFLRSMAARDSLGGLASLTTGTMLLMRALFDVVIVETVGVGQSETDIADLADTMLLAVQPGSGDSLQYMKAGIAELPDVAVVTKADLGPLAEKARHDLEYAMMQGDQGHIGAWPPVVLAVSAQTGAGIEALLDAVDAHAAHLGAEGRLIARRQTQALARIHRAIRDEFGRDGVRCAGTLSTDSADTPFAAMAAVMARLARS